MRSHHHSLSLVNHAKVLHRMINTRSSLQATIRATLSAAGAAGLISMVFSTPAAAAGASSEDALSEVVVTVNKMNSQSVIEVPAAIQAISGDALQAQGATSFEDIAPQIAGLQIRDLGPGDKKYIIRGINSSGDATTGVYFDEAVISGSNANDGGGLQADPGMYDLDHVEVLRGPQGTLYGASSMSGTIRFITKKPDLNSFGGYANTELSNTEKGGGNWTVNGALNMPVIDGQLSARLTGWSVDNSGYISEPRVASGALSGINNERTDGGRAQVRWAPTDALDVLASVTVQNTRSDGSSRYTPAGVTSWGAPGVPGLEPVQGGDLVNTDVTRSPWEDRFQIYGVTVTYKMSSGTLTATANEFDRYVNFNFDSTPILVSFGVPVPAVTEEPQERRVGSGELRYASSLAGPINFVVGAFAQHETNDLTVHVIKANAFGNPAGPFISANSDDALSNPNGNTFFGREDDRLNKSYAGFGEVTWKATDQLSFVGGARYFHETLDGQQISTHPFGGFSGAPTGYVGNNDSFSKTTFKFSADYKMGPEALLYATFAQGFRGGGLNPANLPFASGIPEGFKPDSLNSFEVGAKGKLLNGAFEYDLAAYLMQWQDIQVSEVDTTGAFSFISNAGNARVTGFEFSLDWLPIDHLKLGLSGSAQKAELTSDQPPIPGNPYTGKDGAQLPNVPSFQGSFNVDYSAPLTATLKGTLAGDLSYRGSTFTQINQASPYNVGLAAYSLLNLRAAIASKTWTATVFVRNATDKRAEVDAIASQQDPLAILTVRPRTYGVSLTHTF
jgi:iron complex outermembrane recepter protein